MEDTIRHSIEVIRRRSEVDQEFYATLQQCADSKNSKYVRLLNQVTTIEFNDRLQKQILADTYICHPFLIAPIFSPIADETLYRLSLAGLLYAEHLIINDHIADGDISPEEIFQQITYSSFIRHKSLHILYDLFPPGSEFWVDFSEHTAHYLSTLYQEQQDLAHGAGANSANSFEDAYTQQCIGKSEMAKCMVDALATLSDHPKLKKMLYPVFDHIAIVAQMYDDLMDWKTDLAGNRHNYLLIRFARETHQALDELDADKVRKQLYFSDTLRYHLRYMRKTIIEILQNQLVQKSSPWMFVISYYQSQTEEIERNVELMARRVKQCHQFIDGDAIKRGVAYLVLSQQENGLWTDFYTSARESSDWVTGYVAQRLKNADLEAQVASKSATILTQNQFPEGGWGYSRDIIPDADSTAACLLFMLDYLSPEHTLRHLRALLRFQNGDGGFSTYQDQDAIARVMKIEDKADFSGWCSSQTGVTAASLRSLCAAHRLFPQEHIHDGIIGATKYLLDQQNEDGSWSGYWWLGYYATSMSMVALKDAASLGIVAPVIDRITASQTRAREYIEATQREDGGWGINTEVESCPFQTALALNGLMPVPNSQTEVIQAGLQYLLTCQKINGSWVARTGIMSLPRPDDHRPWETMIDAPTGITLGTRVRDQNYFFTTATVVECLCSAVENDFVEKVVVSIF